ncbi:doublecortin domain-containing protein 2-like isoform X1 [Astatotilapia calliptera]|uniref:Doublecortin domain-containing protein 2 n=1 Tax=Astatotilapia calliptera TaxID=8154 RepID=A0A3P8Q3H6_ASTCA|nr:doublecortin domain-containing protein 2-like isoform X1 [Astatotilapia calliptera]
MSSERPNFLSQPVVKNVFMFRNGDPYYDARRIVINQKRMCNFETLLREVTGGIQAPFGAVRNIYTPRGGHKVDCLESLRSGEQYVAAGREKFKKLDYLQIGSRKKKMMQTVPVQIKPFPPNRFIVSARFLKPIKEPCTIFVVANGDILNSAVRLLVHQRILGQFDKILEMITEKMGLRVLGGVRSLFTYEGQQVTEGNQLESGQLYVAVGREKFKKLPYSDLLFTKPRGTRRVRGMKSYSLPPIYRFSKQSENGKSMVQSSDSGDGESPKASPPSHNKEHLSSIVREISQARLLSLKKIKSRQSLTPGASDNDELEQKFDEGNADCQKLEDNGPEAKLDATDTNETEENVEKPEEKEEVATENGREEGDLPSSENKMNNQETNGEKEGGGGGKTEIDGQKDGKGEDIAENEKKVEEKKEDPEKNKKVFNGEEYGSSSDKALDSKETEDGNNMSFQGERRKIVEDEKEDKDHTEVEKSTTDHTNDVDTVEEQKKTGNGNDPETTQLDNETKENDSSRSSRGNSNQEEDENETKEGTTKESGEEEESKVNAEVSGEDNEVEGEAELNTDEKK